jgi:hypothetical protein
MEAMGNTIKDTQGTRFTVVEMVMVIMGMVDMDLQEGMALADLGEMGMIQEKVHLHLQKARSCNLHVTFVVDVNSSKSSSSRERNEADGRCDGIRPECSNCNKRGENCIFDESVRRRGPGKRTKDIRGRSGHDIQGHNEGNFSAYVLNDPSHVPLGGPSHDTHQSTPDLEQMAAAASANQHYHETNMAAGNLPEIDPNIDPALAILGMGIDAGPSNSPIPPATLAEADPTRGQKRKSDLTGEDDGKRLKLEDETYEGTLPSTDLGGGVGDIPGFGSWTGEGREEEVNEEDLEKFENDLRRVIQDQAEAEIEAMEGRALE